MYLHERLRYAREHAGLTLVQVKEITGIAESSISDFENGKREPRLSQLQSLGRVYHRSLEFLLSDEELPAEVVLWRECPKDNYKDIEARFLKYCANYRNLEIWNDDVIEPYLPPVTGDVNGYDIGDVEALAKQVRDMLGLGSHPALELQRVLEETCGAKVFHMRFQPTGTAASTRSDEIGLAILLNSENKRWRRNFDLAHELYHLLVWKALGRKADESCTRSGEKEERLANAFAGSLLMPAETFSSVMRHYNSVEGVPVSVYFDVARKFDVSVDAVVWRWHNLCRTALEENEKTRAVLQQVKKIGGLFEQREDTRPPQWPDRFRSLAVEALHNGRISIGRFAEYLDISRRAAMDYIAQEAGESEETQAAPA